MASQTLFINASLVGYPAGRYSVLVGNGKIKSISKGPIHFEGFEVVDLAREDGDSWWISPGLVDNHTHFKWWSMKSHRLDLASATSAKQALSMVTNAISLPRFSPDVNPDFAGVNLRIASWPDVEDMNRLSLDAISDRPIYLTFNGYHSMCCNSSGLRKAGIKPEGHSGILEEGEAFRVAVMLGQISEDIMDGWIDETAKHAASLGVTEIVDLEMDHNISAWGRRYEKGFRTLRVRCGMYEEHIGDAIKLKLHSGDDVPGTNGMITVGPAKIITDGSIGSRTAYCHEPYPGTDNHGVWAYKDDRLSEMIHRRIHHGFNLAIHAIGDRANNKVLKVLQDIPHPLPEGSTIEHAQLLDFTDIPLFRKLGLTASIQPAHLIDDRDLCHRFWPGREERAYAFKSLVDAGIPIKMGSDCPVTPLDPWEAMAAAVSRAGEGEEAFCPGERIDIATAFAASTCNGKNGIMEGEVADLCLLSSDPLACDAKGLRGMKVGGTMIAGEWTFNDTHIY